jgi:predicted O-methyltransferase YrrM
VTPEQIKHNLNIPGWFTENDMRGLAALARTVTNGTIIELGSMHGKSSYCLSVSSPTSKIYCLDYWSGWIVKTDDDIERPNSIDVFKSFTKDCSNITPIHLSMIEKVIPAWEEPVDMVFIDAAHTNPDDWNCIEFWLPKIKPHGIICGHDYYNEFNSPIIHYPDVVENVARLEKMLNKKMILHKNSCVWSIRL